MGMLQIHVNIPHSQNHRSLEEILLPALNVKQTKSHRSTLHSLSIVTDVTRTTREHIQKSLLLVRYPVQPPEGCWKAPFVARIGS